MQTIHYFTRRQVIKEREKYLDGRIRTYSQEPEKYAAIIQEWLHNVGCFYCGKPWSIVYNERGEDKFFVCSKQKCKTMAKFKYLDYDVRRWTKGNRWTQR